MSERTALEIAAKLYGPNAYRYIGEAYNMLRQQHAEIERLKADAKSVNSHAKNLAIAMHRRHFSHITQWEPLPDTIGLITQIDNMSCWTRDDVARLTASREAAIAAAVTAEREACAAVCDELEAMFPGTKTGNTLQWAAEKIRSRSAT